MSRFIAILTVVTVGCLMVFSVGAWAIGNQNELSNPGFEQGGQDWEVNDANIVLFGAQFDRDHVAYDPAGQGESGFMRQIVNDSLYAGWNPNYNHKIGYLDFMLYTTGPSYVQVGISWWDTMSNTKPTGFGPPGTDGYHYEILTQHYTSVDNWSPVSITYDWAGKAGNNQPKWVGVEFYFYEATGGAIAAIDDVSFVGQCVPEPSSMMALAGSLFGLAGLAFRRRR